MEITGNLRKMDSAFETGKGENVQYFLPMGKEMLPMNAAIGNPIKITFLQQINCIKCDRKTKRSFSQGFCYPCFKTAPEADPAIIKPELDQSHLGISRDMAWAKKNTLVDHYVYIALSSGIKVGVTRAANLPHRWIDQGAIRAVKLAKTPHRQLAGLIEVALKAQFADRTNWRKMLTNAIDNEADLIAAKRKAQTCLPEALKRYYVEDDEITHIHYPVIRYPSKVTSLGLDKHPVIEGVLTGIKGQYLYIDEKNVFNVRKHNGYLAKVLLG